MSCVRLFTTDNQFVVRLVRKRGSRDMVSCRITRPSLLTTIVLALLVLTGMATTPLTASAHPSPKLKGTVTINGKAYSLSEGVALKVPVTFANGEKGYVGAIIGQNV